MGAQLMRTAPSTPAALSEHVSHAAEEQASGREALRGTEGGFQLLFARNPLPMWIYDRGTYEFLEVNDAAVEHYGYSREEFLQMKLTDIRPAEDIPNLLKWMAEHPEPVAHTGPWRHRLKNGCLIQVEVSQHRLPFAGHDAALVVVMDTTEKLRAAELLAASENRLRSIVEAEPQCVTLLDADGALLDINPAGLRIIEAGDPGQVLGKPVCSLVCPDQREPFRSVIANACRGEGGVLEFKIHGLRGTERWLEMHAAPFRSEDGRVVAVLAVTADVTERRRAEQALRESQARDRDLVENTTYGIFRTTAGGRFLDANPALMQMLGWATASEVSSASLVQDVFRYPEEFATFLASCREKRRVSGFEAEWRRKDGAHIAVRLSGRLVERAKELEVLEVFAEDVTELRAVEKQLRQAQKFEAVAQLAGGVAHDFNNVVGAILGWAEIGMEEARHGLRPGETPGGTPGGMNARLFEFFAKIRTQSERAAALTRQLLAYARQQVLQPRPVDLNSVVRGLLSFLDKVIGGDIELKVITTPAVELIRVDPTQIEQVLMNLCLNARDAMPEGGRLLIETEPVQIDEAYCRSYPYAKPGGYVVLSVSDTGTGMDAATRERIFEPFFTTKEPGKGSGLGLATAYGIVKQHGGFIQVYSELDYGTLFRVYLPTLGERLARSGEQTCVPVASCAARGTETILLAEDHDAIREMARQALATLGYRVLSASNGEEALKICETEVPDLVILDVVMPRLNGPGLYRLLAKRFPGVPAIFTTGYTAEHASLEGRNGAAVLQKPYNPGALVRLVREVLDKATQAPHENEGQARS